MFRVLRFGERGACEYCVQLLHWYSIYLDPISKSDCLLGYEFLIAAFQSIEVLAAGCKPNRDRLGKCGACSYAVHALRRHGQSGALQEFCELAFNVIWQLSFGNIENRSLLRQSGAENELHRVVRCQLTPQSTRNRASTVLGWLKSQVLFN
jgi:hypothetical protein